MKAPALYDNQRSIMFRWGMLAAVTACTLAPLCSESSMSISASGSSFAPLALTASEGRRGVPPTLARDPFIPKATDLPENVVVRAVVLGAAPRALVQVGAQTMLVGVGDAVGGVPVVAIDDRGVRLSDGSLLRFQESGP